MPIIPASRWQRLEDQNTRLSSTYNELEDNLAYVRPYLGKIGKDTHIERKERQTHRQKRDRERRMEGRHRFRRQRKIKNKIAISPANLFHFLYLALCSPANSTVS